MDIIKFEVYEDNAGYIHIAVVENAACVEIINYIPWDEPAPLYTGLAELIPDPYDYKNWAPLLTEQEDISAEGLQLVYRECVDSDALIAEFEPYNAAEHGALITIYPDSMGISGLKAFGLPTDC